MILWLYHVRIHCIVLYYIISQSITLSHIALYCITLYYIYIALYYIIVYYIIVYYFIVVYYIIVYYCISHYIISHMILSCIYIGTYMYICYSCVYLTIYHLWLRKIEEHCVILWCKNVFVVSFEQGTFELGIRTGTLLWCGPGLSILSSVIWTSQWLPFLEGNWGKIIEHLGIGCLKDDEAGWIKQVRLDLKSLRFMCCLDNLRGLHRQTWDIGRPKVSSQQQSKNIWKHLGWMYIHI